MEQDDLEIFRKEYEKLEMAGLRQEEFKRNLLSYITSVAGQRIYKLELLYDYRPNIATYNLYMDVKDIKQVKIVFKLTNDILLKIVDGKFCGHKILSQNSPLVCLDRSNHLLSKYKIPPKSLREVWVKMLILNFDIKEFGNITSLDSLKN